MVGILLLAAGFCECAPPGVRGVGAGEWEAWATTVERNGTVLSCVFHPLPELGQQCLGEGRRKEERGGRRKEERGGRKEERGGRKEEGGRRREERGGREEGKGGGRILRGKG